MTLYFADGTHAQGDLLVGADGVKSTARRCLFGDDEAQFTGMIAWRGVIPMDRLLERLRDMLGWTWIGPGGHLVNYRPARGQINEHDRHDRARRLAGGKLVHARFERGMRPGDFAGWHEDVQTLIRAAPSVMKWAFAERAPRQTWSVGRATLLGDACHATLPFLAQGAVMSIEDGVCVGLLPRQICRSGRGAAPL